MNSIENRKPIRIIYENDDFGIYKYNPEKKRYEGMVGYLTIESLLKSVNTNYFIKVEYVDEN